MTPLAENLDGAGYDVFALCDECEKAVILRMLFKDPAAKASAALGFTPMKRERPNRDFRVVGTLPEPPGIQVPPDLPAAVEGVMRDAEGCFVNNLRSPAIIHYRKTLECALDDLFPAFDKLRLVEKIRQAAKGQLLPEALADWINEVRLAGNGAAHDVEADPSSQDVAEIREFTYLFLTCVYSLPARVKRAKARRTDVPLDTLIG